MEPYRSLALLAGSLALVSALVALSTDFWFVAIGPGFTVHAGLWQKGDLHLAAGFIHVTQSFSILAALSGLVSVGLLVLSCIPSLFAPGRGPLVASIEAFMAAFFMLVAMAVYTGHQWNLQHPQIQFFFSWSFYLGWVSIPLWLIAGSLGLVAHSRAPRPGYDQV